MLDSQVMHGSDMDLASNKWESEVSNEFGDDS